MRSRLDEVASTCNPQSILAVTQLSDVQLLGFLRAHRFHIKKAIAAALANNSFINAHPEVFAELRGGEEFRPLYAAGFVRVLRGLDKKNRRIVILSPKLFDPALWDPTLLLRWRVTPSHLTCLSPSTRHTPNRPPLSPPPLPFPGKCGAWDGWEGIHTSRRVSPLPL